MSELRQFKLPDVGEGLTEADIVRWHVAAGDPVTVNQIIVEIETAKAVVELPCPFEGIVAELLAAAGSTVDVGVPIISVQVGAAPSGGVPPLPAGVPVPGGGPVPGVPVPGVLAAGVPVAGRSGPATPGSVPDSVDAALALTGPGSAAADLVPALPAQHAAGAGAGAPAGAVPREERQPVLVGYGVKLGATTRRTRKTPPPPPARPEPRAPAGGLSLAAPPTVLVPPAALAPPAPGARVAAKPPVRKLARDLGISLATLAGSGPSGSVTRADVQAAVLARDAQPPPAAAGIPAWKATGTGAAGAAAREERIAIRGVRKHTAAAMSASAFTAPHVTEFLQIDITAAMTATARLKAMPEFADARVSPLLLVAKALLIAAARHPLINASWDEAAQEIVIKHYVNLGIAAATDRGLVVPNIRDAHALALPALARALADLADTARSGKATPADLQGGTITITNVGVFGIDTGTPILSPGETAILAFGRVKDAPWVHEGQLAVRQVTTLALSFDHRVADGDLGSAVLRDVGAMLTDPVHMLAWQ